MAYARAQPQRPHTVRSHAHDKHQTTDTHRGSALERRRTEPRRTSQAGWLLVSGCFSADRSTIPSALFPESIGYGHQA